MLLEKQSIVDSCTGLLHQTNPLTAASSITTPAQVFLPKTTFPDLKANSGCPACWMHAGSTAPLLPTLSFFSLPCLFPPLSFMAGIWKPFLFIHSTRMPLLAALQQAESSDSPQGHFRGCMRSSQLFAGSVWARYISVEAAWPSVHMGHPGLSESQGWKAVRVLPESGW